MTIIVFGLPGSGKSYFAERLAKKIGAEYLNSDRIRKTMFSSRTYSKEEKAAVYAEMLKKMKERVYQNRDIVLDATFHLESNRKAFIQGTKDGQEIIFIEVKADENITRERLKNKRPDSDADFEVYRLLKEQWEPMNREHLLLKSTNENIESMLQQAVLYLQRNNDKRTD